MISVAEAEYLVLSEVQDYGTEEVSIGDAEGRILAEQIAADRDIPPYDRVTMDGIAINYSGYEEGSRSFRIKGVQMAGDEPIEIEATDECIEIMTGASLPATTDTVVRYEDLEISNGYARITAEVKRGKNIHYKGTDKKKNELLTARHCIITPAVISTAASVGMSKLQVKKMPKVAVITTGNEVIPVAQVPNPFQVRRSNSYAIEAILKCYHVPTDILHIPDNEDVIRVALSNCLEEYDALILCGAVSMGKHDYVPGVLEDLDVQKKFHKVAQRPGKPFWFGVDPEDKLVFAFPGNPVSTFMCTHRYFIPWLRKTSGLAAATPAYAELAEDFSFEPMLKYFLQVKLQFTEDGKIKASPSEGNGSGDFVNLLQSDAFMELPENTTNFKKGEAYRIWPFKPLL